MDNMPGMDMSDMPPMPGIIRMRSATSPAVPWARVGRAGGGGDWSSYYNGYIYGSEMGRGTDVLKLVPTKYLTQNEIDAAAHVHYAELNVQDQPHIEAPRPPSPRRLMSINSSVTMC